MPYLFDLSYLSYLCYLLYLRYLVVFSIGSICSLCPICPSCSSCPIRSMLSTCSLCPMCSIRSLCPNLFYLAFLFYEFNSSSLLYVLSLFSLPDLFFVLLAILSLRVLCVRIVLCFSLPYFSYALSLFFIALSVALIRFVLFVLFLL